MDKGKKIGIILFVSLFLLVCGQLQSAIQYQDWNSDPDTSGIPQAFKITPEKDGDYYLPSVHYNSVTDRYVVFYIKVTNKIILFSRVYKPNGKPEGSVKKVITWDDKNLGYLDFAFSPQDNAFFLVGCDAYFSLINGVFLDGNGRFFGDIEKDYVVIKPEAAMYSAIRPLVSWIEQTNQYAVQWIGAVPYKPENPRNGAYLSVVNSDGSIAVKRKKVIRQTMNNNELHFASLTPVGNRLVWGSTEDGPGTSLSPVVWFTNLKGKLLKNIKGSSQGMIYPGKPDAWVKEVSACYDPEEEVYILYWDTEDHEDYKKLSSITAFYRLMDKNGKLTGSALGFPKKTAFQFKGIIRYNPVEKRFFRVYNECRIYFQSKPPRDIWGSKLYGVYLDSEGNFQDKKGKSRLKPIPLTGFFLNPDYSVYLGGVVYNEPRNEYFIFYLIYDIHNRVSEIWGFIYTN